MPSLVYDISTLDNLSSFCYDVKILYQLKGDKVKSFTDLCHACLASWEAEDYHRSCQKIKAQLRSYCQCGISVEEFFMQELMPKGVLERMELEKQKLVDRLFYRFSNEQIIAFYERFFTKLQCLHRISKNLNLKFNFVGTKTGRLSFQHNTFNPYVLPKEKRDCIRARAGYKIYEFDLKSSQPRIAIFSTFDDRFKADFDHEDIYSIFAGNRDDNKISFLRWMYSSSYAADDRFGKVASPIKELRTRVFEQSLNGCVRNQFGRPLFFAGEPDNIVFQNFIASTEADSLYEIVCAMQSVLDNTQSRILFPFYDAIICEIKDDEVHIAERLKEVIENNYVDHIFFCKFPVEVKCGQDFGHMSVAA